METVQYKCPYCGGELKLNPDTGSFSCEYCQSDFDEQQMQALYGDQNEQAMQQADPEVDTLQNDQEAAHFAAHKKLYECPSCGAQVIAEDTTSATFCYYCHSPVILAGRLSGDYCPSQVIPFTVSREAAVTTMKQWCKKRWFLPSDFKRQQQLEKMTGVYAPFWLADCETRTDYHAIGKETRSWKSGDYEITETKEYAVHRDVSIPFVGIPADGAKKMEDEMMDALEPYDYQALRPFQMQYLSGFMAEKYDIVFNDVFPRIQKRVNQGCKGIIAETTRQYSSVSVKSCNTQYQKVQNRYVLMPVWFMTYLHRGKRYSFALNGQTGKLVGTPPLSYAKLLGCCAGLMALVALIGMLGGYLLR